MNVDSQFAINTNSLAEQAYMLLEEKLVTLALPPGAMISEGDLIDLTALGRTPVREAIQRLASQEFLNVLPRKGLLVTSVSRSGMLHILEARKPLERLIVYRASLNARDEQRGGLSAIARALTISYDSFDEFVSLLQDVATRRNEIAAQELQRESTDSSETSDESDTETSGASTASEQFLRVGAGHSSPLSFLGDKKNDLCKSQAWRIDR